MRKDQEREAHKNVPNIEMDRVGNLQTREEVKTVLSSPLPSSTVTHSTENILVGIEVVDLTQ